MNDYYHFTNFDNFKNIQEKGLTNKPVFLCESEKDCLEFLKIYQVIGQNYAVLKIKSSSLDKSELEQSEDHNRDYINVNAYTYHETIKPETIELVNIYSIGN